MMWLKQEYISGLKMSKRDLRLQDAFHSYSNNFKRVLLCFLGFNTKSSKFDKVFGCRLQKNSSNRSAVLCLLEEVASGELKSPRLWSG